MSGTPSEQEATYIFREYLLNIMRIALRRRHDLESSDDVSEIYRLLHQVCRTIASKVGPDEVNTNSVFN